MSRTTTVIESLPLNWDVFDDAYDTEEAQRFSATFRRMFADWISHHYAPLNLSLCGNEVIGPVEHSELPDSLYGAIMEWINSGHHLYCLLDCYDSMADEGELDSLFGAPTLKGIPMSVKHTPSKPDDRQPVAMFVGGELACLVMANRMLTPHQVCNEYAEYTGFERSTVRCYYFGLNILQID